MNTTAKTSRFQIGDRVKLNEHARKSSICQRRFESGETSGLVVGKGRASDIIIVQLDGNATGTAFASMFFDPEPPQPAPGFAGGKFNPKFLGNPLLPLKGNL